jgi:hypothetical protein
MKRFLLLFAACTAFAFAQRGVPVIDTAPVNAVFFEFPDGAIPTSSTDMTPGVTGKDCYPWLVHVVNTSGSERTLTMVNGSGVVTIPPATLANNSETWWVYPSGKLLAGGCKWVASGAGLTGYAKGKRAR